MIGPMPQPMQYQSKMSPMMLMYIQMQRQKAAQQAQQAQDPASGLAKAAGKGAKDAAGVGAAGAGAYGLSQLGSGAAMATEAGNVAGAAAGAGNAAPGFLAANAGWMGPAAFMATAPIWGPQVAKIGDAVGSKVFGMNTKSNRKFNADEIANSRSKGLSTQLPGLSSMPQDTKKTLLSKLYDMNVLALPGKEGVNKNNEYLSLSRLMKPDGNSRVSESGVRKMGDHTSMKDLTKGDINWKGNVKAGFRNELESLLGQAYGASQPAQPSGAPMMDRMWQEGRDPGKAPLSSQIANYPAWLSGVAPTTAPARSQTSSPGISKSGQRINYGRR